MNIAVIVGVLIAIVVGVIIIPTMTDTINSASSSINNGDGAPTAVSSLMNILPIIVIAVMILGVVAFMSHRVWENSSSSDSDDADEDSNEVGKSSISVVQSDRNLLEDKYVLNDMVEDYKTNHKEDAAVELPMVESNNIWDTIETGSKNNEVIEKEEIEKNIEWENI